MSLNSGWLDSLFDRLGLTHWVGPIRAFLRRAWSGEPMDGQPEVRSATPQSPSHEPSTESPMPTKKSAAKSKSPSRTPAAKAPKRAAKKAPAKKAPAKKASSARKSNGATRAATSDALNHLMDALHGHPSQKELVAAGQEKDQLMRALIPLFLARSKGLEVTSGTTSRFWSNLGVVFAAPNAAKALRIHTGYAKGKNITAKGIRYVEDAIARG